LEINYSGKILSSTILEIRETGGDTGLSLLPVILLAAVIAFSIGWFAMNKWLQNFAYKINIGITVFIVSSVSVLLIALLTVGYQTIRAAKANPVDSLKYE